MGRAIGIQSPVGKAKVDPQPTARAEPSDIKREIVDGARAGDPEALANLYDWYLPRVYRYVLGRVGNVMEAEDLTEEIFLKMLGGISGFHWRKAPFSAWLFRIARNQVVTYFRRAGSAVTPGPLVESALPSVNSDDHQDPLAAVEMRIALEGVREAVRGLPEAQREVILLRFGSDLSVKETAKVLGKREGTVKVLQYKGVRRLQELFGTRAGDQFGDVATGTTPTGRRVSGVA